MTSTGQSGTFSGSNGSCAASPLKIALSLSTDCFINRASSPVSSANLSMPSPLPLAVENGTAVSLSTTRCSLVVCFEISGIVSLVPSFQSLNGEVYNSNQYVKGSLRNVDTQLSRVRSSSVIFGPRSKLRRKRAIPRGLQFRVSGNPPQVSGLLMRSTARHRRA